MKILVSCVYWLLWRWNINGCLLVEWSSFNFFGLLTSQQLQHIFNSQFLSHWPVNNTWFFFKHLTTVTSATSSNRQLDCQPKPGQVRSFVHWIRSYSTIEARVLDWQWWLAHLCHDTIWAPSYILLILWSHQTCGVYLSPLTGTRPYKTLGFS